MSTHFPQSATGLSYETAPAGPSSVDNTLTAGGSNNTKGSYVQFTASLGFTCNKVHITTTFGSTAFTSLLIDVATGAGGAESVKIPNLLANNVNNTENYNPFYFEFPLEVPSGTRVALRCQASTASRTITVGVQFVAAGGTSGISTFSQHGGDTGSSTGVAVDPGGTANVKGSYSVLTSSSAILAQSITLVLHRVNGTVASLRWCIDLATGAGGAEVVLIPDVRSSQASYSATYIGHHPNSFTFLTYIPAATRIAVRASCNVNTATARNFDCQVVLGTAPSEFGSALKRHPGMTGGFRG